ncbi:MAG: zinc ribbon domain-containing protein [Candidatus Methylomirabilia bacterium]
MDSQLRLLIDLQGLDSKIAALEGELARLPGRIDAIQSELGRVLKAVESLNAKQDQTRKEIHLKEKDLEYSASKRSKAEARLYEVKTNKEYSAVLAEIEEIKQEKSRIEEQILALMESQERLIAQIRETEGQRANLETKGKAEEAEIRSRMAAVEADLALLRSDRRALVAELPADLVASYGKLLRHRAHLAIVPVLHGGICGGCRVSLTPQIFQEVRQQATLHTCESCGRYLYWLPG